MTSPHDYWPLLKQTVSEWTEDKVPRLGASLAFYTALSIAPLLVISLRAASLVFGDEAGRGELESQFQALIGDEGAKAVQAMIAGGDRPTEGTVATLLGAGMLVFGASGVFVQLQDCLNTIWEVRPKPGRGFLGIVRDRVFSFAMVLGVAFLLLVSLAVTTALAALGAVFDNLPAGLQFVGVAVNFGVSLAVVTVLFALMFKYVPDVKVAWRDVWLGALLTAVLFTLGKLGIGLYLGRGTLASAYGVAGSFVVLLVWVYYSAQILFFGAEFTQVYANRFGSRIVPAENAEPVTERAKAQQGLASSGA